MKIIIAAGGTGGHVFPAVCVANELIKLKHHVKFIVDQRGIKYLSSLDKQITIEQQKILNSPIYSKYMWLIIQFCRNIIAFIINRPNIVIGFGGYPSLSPVFAAQCIGITTIIHEQNAVFGKANKFLSKLAKKILTGFPMKNDKCIYVGNPTRFDNSSCIINTKNSEYITILILGGSQGANIFDLTVSEIISQLARKYKLKIIHQGKQENIQKIQTTYSGIFNITQSFFNNMQEIYTQTDLVICRAGASTVSELIHFNLPSVIVPYKHSVNGDQTANAKYLQNHQAAIVVDENEICDKLPLIIQDLITNKNKLLDMQKNISTLQIPNSTQNVIREILNFPAHTN